MSSRDLAFEEGFLEMLQKVSFCWGFLEACEEDGLDPVETVEAAHELVESGAQDHSGSPAVEPLKLPCLDQVHSPETETEWIRNNQSLSPPWSVKHAA